jgi:Domain of unknown function (DUF1707)
VTTGPGDQTAPGAAAYGRFLASHTDREQAVDKLKAAFVEGRLTKDELDARAGQAFAARTYADLAALTADIPAGSAGARSRPEPAWVQGRPPVSKRAVVLRLAACAIILPIVLTVVILSHNEGLAETVISPLVYIYLMALMIGVSHLVDSRLERRRSRRPGGQRPPDWRGPGGQVKGGPRGKAGHDSAPPEARIDQTRADLRADSSRRDRPASSWWGVGASRGIRPLPGPV